VLAVFPCIRNKTSQSADLASLSKPAIGFLLSLAGSDLSTEDSLGMLELSSTFPLGLMGLSCFPCGIDCHLEPEIHADASVINGFRCLFKLNLDLKGNEELVSITVVLCYSEIPHGIA
jgi:hypothetical protein